MKTIVERNLYSIATINTHESQPKLGLDIEHGHDFVTLYKPYCNLQHGKCHGPTIDIISTSTRDRVKWIISLA